MFRAFVICITGALLWVAETVEAGPLYFSSEFVRQGDPTLLTQKEGGDPSPFPNQELFSDVERPPETSPPAIENFQERFAQGKIHFGFQVGYGQTFILGPDLESQENRTRIDFLYFFPNWKYNLTGITGDGFLKGALYWVIETGVAFSVKDPNVNGEPVDQAPTFVVGLIPLGLEYKFLNPKRRWAPLFFAGAGISVSDWHKSAREISTAYEFILNAGGGLEYFLSNGTSISINYRVWHISNANIETPNIGLNSHIFTFGFSF